MFAVQPIARACAPMMIVATVITLMAACGSSSNNNTPTTPTTPTCTATGFKQYVLDTNVVDQNACSKLMFAKYQIAAFSAVNQGIINIAANANQTGSLGDSFQTQIVQKGDARVAEFTANLAAFLVDAFGQPTDPNYIAYTGPKIPVAHATLNITTAQYEYFVTDVIAPVLEGLQVPLSDIVNCFAPVVMDPNFKVQVIACQ